MPCPTHNDDSVAKLSRRFRKVMALRFWNLACCECSTGTPLCVIQSPLSSADVRMAHGMVCQGSLGMISDFLDKCDTDAGVDTSGALGALKATVCYPVNPSPEVRDFSNKLAHVYNFTSTLATGTVMHVTGTDGHALVVCLQSIYLGSEPRDAAAACA